MQMRIQKLLSDRGLCSRRKAEEWIKEGRVAVNGVACNLGDTADPDIDTVTVDGNPVPAAQKRLYIMLHKPRGFVTTLSDEKGRPNAAQLVDCGQRVYPVGRLDMDSEGLLLFTNDGQWANQMMHPRGEVEKVYRVTVKGYQKAALDKLARPIVLDGYRIRPPKIQLLSAGEDTAQILVTIHEGRNRQVRRMCAAAGMQVQRLVRVSEGPLQLGELPLGKWRYLTDEEITILKKHLQF